MPEHQSAIRDPQSEIPLNSRVSVAVQLAKHLITLHSAAIGCGFTPEVTGPLSKAAVVAEAEAKQMTCPHGSKSTSDITSRQVRTRFVICVDCHKTIRTEDI